MFDVGRIGRGIQEQYNRTSPGLSNLADERDAGPPTPWCLTRERKEQKGNIRRQAVGNVGGGRGYAAVMVIVIVSAKTDGNGEKWLTARRPVSRDFTLSLYL